MSTPRAWLAAACCSGACLAALACQQGSPRLDDHFEPPRLRRAAENPARRAVEYAIGPHSRIDLMLVGRARPVRGELPVTSGRLWVDSADLSATRGTLTFDLSELRWWDAGSKAPPGGSEATTLTEQSLDWLQVSPSHDIQTHPELRYARFTLLAIGSSSSHDLDTPTVRPGQPAALARRVRLRASGELELHGHRLPQTLSVVATFEWSEPAEPGAPPRRVRIETSEPFRIDLLAHGIAPRNARGEVVAQAFAELRRLGKSPVQASVSWQAELAASELAASELAPSELAATGAGPTASDR